ncbi:MAG: HAD family phosphatase [Chloroflexi bacterium]|nr:HAD family phosphatase [Chloroflexota bacterium]
MKKTRAVILDLDGLIVDSEPLHQRAFSDFLARQNIQHQFTVAEYGKSFVGIPVIENARWLIERFNLRMQVRDVIAAREAIYEALIADPANLVAMPGVFDLLDQLAARNVPLAVASGSPRNQVIAILNGLGITPRLRAIVAGDDVPRTKPAPDVYLRAAKQIGIAPAECVAVEDSATGVTAAKSAGMRAIAVPNQYTAHQDLSHADARVDQLTQVLELL